MAAFSCSLPAILVKEVLEGSLADLRKEDEQRFRGILILWTLVHLRTLSSEEVMVTKTSKNLKKLSRSDLLELLIEQSKEIDRLQAELADSDAVRIELEERNAYLEENAAGMNAVSDAAVRRVMAGADVAVEEIVAKNQLRADAIIEDARREAAEIVADANEEAAIIRKYAKMLMSDAREEAGQMRVNAQSASDNLLAETRRSCTELLAQAQSEIDALFDEADMRAMGGWRS